VQLPEERKISLNLIKPGKRENRRPNPRPAPIFVVFELLFS